MKRIRRRVEKEDFSRILLTETATYDVPIIFSNLGFYWHWKKYLEKKSLFPLLMKNLFDGDDPTSYTIPLTFKIRKNAESFRSLSLIHPRSQVKFIEFYKSFDQQILLACQKSRFSLRYPEKIGNKYYSRNINENKNKYKTRSVSNVEFESKSKYLTTYFSYRSHTRLHSFFDSSDFLNLEKKYTTFWSIDVARCFDSVYTHSITWALKNKKFSKVNKSVTNSFGAIFDRLMQSTNYNETAGIVIGSEVSRIFAEIIFQKIDQNIFSLLIQRELFDGVDYTIRRYVDDIYIFSKSDEVAKIVLDVVISKLNEYKFSINENKTIKDKRPFITEQSKSLKLVKNSYNILIDKILKSKDGSEKKIPIFIYNRKKLLVSFLQEVKLACVDSLISYGMVAGYLISTFSNLLINFIDSNLELELENDSEKSRYANFCYIAIEVIFHLYTVSPSQNGSIKIGLIINSACKFFDMRIPDESNAIRSKIYTLSNDFFESSGFYSTTKDDDNVATLEALNVLAAIKILGSNFLVSRQIIERIVNISADRKMSYFEIITLLYYMDFDVQKSYSEIKRFVLKSIKRILCNLSDIKENSEKAYLLLDVLACPFIDPCIRKKYAKALLNYVNSSAPSDEEAQQFQKDLARYPWFTSWDSAQILNSLEKKELLKSY